MKEIVKYISCGTKKIKRKSLDLFNKDIKIENDENITGNPAKEEK
jgi:hypothetical protein